MIRNSTARRSAAGSAGFRVSGRSSGFDVRRLASACSSGSMKALAVGGMDDHAHILLSLSSTIAVAKAMQQIKAASSKWMHKQHQQRGFEWQEGYGAFSINQSQRQTVIDYIARQAEHHQKWSFEQEFMTLLKRSGVEYDPRFVLG